jgi:hypothetical protein
MPAAGRSIIEYRWDCNSDGIFEFTEYDPVHVTTYFAPGQYTPVVRVVQDDGTFADASTQVTVQGSSSEVEPNDSAAGAQAVNTPLGTFYGEIGPGSEFALGGANDVFEITGPDTGTIAFSLYYQVGFAPIGLYFTDVNEEIIDVDIVDDGALDITAVTAPGSTYYLKVITLDNWPGTSPYLLSGIWF